MTTAAALNPIARLGRGGIRTVVALGRLGRFALYVAGQSRRRPVRVRRIATELYHVGVLSIPIIGVSGVAVGMVLGLQGYNALVGFGAEETLGTFVSLTLVRELGPVLTGLLVAGRAGSAIAAEIGSMVVTEQLDGLRMLSIDPIDFVVSPKTVAVILCMPLLAALFIVLGLGGGYLVGVVFLGVDGGGYLTSIESAIELVDDVAGSSVKSLVFGVLVGLIATFRGYTAAPSAAGVASATTSTVVISSVTILITDYVITALWGV